jgi:hypothetical protein
MPKLFSNWRASKLPFLDPFLLPAPGRQSSLQTDYEGGGNLVTNKQQAAVEVSMDLSSGSLSTQKLVTGPLHAQADSAIPHHI